MKMDQLIFNKAPSSLLFAVLCIQAAIVVMIALVVQDSAWDDGAITLAYARTFAETGRIALTSASDQVEGYSTTSWFLINSLFRIFNPNFKEAILASQLASALFLWVTTYFIWLIARSISLKSGTTFCILLIFSMFGPSISEVSNGMEMTLLAASGVALVYCLYFKTNWFLLIISVIFFLTTRFEAIIYYFVILSPLLVYKRFRLFGLLSLLGILVCGAQELERYIYFDALIPNTVLAKMHAPYSVSGLTAAVNRIRSTTEIIFVAAPIFLAGVIIYGVAWKRRKLKLAPFPALPSEFLPLLAPIAAIELVSLLTGPAGGYAGRIQFLAFPFLLLLFGLVWDRILFETKAKFRFYSLVAISLLTIVSSWRLIERETLSAIARAAGFKPSGAGEYFGITPASYWRIGLAVEKLREVLALKTIVFATPDVGGLALCCDDIRVVDLALLTNHRLAAGGYEVLASVLAEEKPDIIEDHELWAAFSHIYELPHFQANYVPFMVDSIRLFLRSDHIPALFSANRAKWCNLEEPECRLIGLETHKYKKYALKLKEDDAAFSAQGKFILFQ